MATVDVKGLIKKPTHKIDHTRARVNCLQ